MATTRFYIWNYLAIQLYSSGNRGLHNCRARIICKYAHLFNLLCSIGDLRTYLESWGIDPDTGGLFRAEVEEELGYTQEQLTACFTQWERDQAAVQSGSDDETALRATAYDCPNYDAWSLGFNLYSSGNEATMIQALCAFEANSPVCRDAESRGIL